MGNAPVAQQFFLLTVTNNCPTVCDVTNLRRNAKFGRF